MVAVVALCAGAAPAAQAARADLCATGQRQSPIDIRATTRTNLPPLSFAYRSAPLRVANDGHTVRVRFSNGSQLRIGGRAATLRQFHVHLPGGDRLQGEAFPMALHFLHKTAEGQLVAVVVLFRVGAENPALAALLPHLARASATEHELPGVTVDALSLIPPQPGYYAYDGSETAPPCTEGVRWLVMKHALPVSERQLNTLRALFPANARAVQPLHARVVQESAP